MNTVRQWIQRTVERLRSIRRRAPAAPAPPLPPVPSGDAHGRVIGVLNYKGGTAKTTTVVNVAAGLARRGARVLCVDLDAQGGLATWLNVPYTHSLAHLLMGEAEARECIVQARENLDFIASDRSLLEAERWLWRVGEQGRHVLAGRMQDVDEYDYIILDFSPSRSLVGECGLLYSQEIIVPVAMDYMALVGTRQVVETLKSVDQAPAHAARLTLIVPTFYNERQRLDREVIGLLQTHFPGKVADPIRANVKLSEAPSHGMTIYEYAPRSTGAEDYTRLVERIARGG